MSLRHHWTKNFSIPALFMPRLVTITAFPGFVYVFNNSYFWLWYSRLRTCDIFIVITSGRIAWYRYHSLIASRPFLGNSDGIDESITTRFFINLNSFSKESHYSLTKTIPGDSLSARKWWYVVSDESGLKNCFRNVFQS